MRKYLILGAVISLALSACSMTPAYLRPQMDIPEGWSTVSNTTQPPPQREASPFWQEFANEDLNRLVDIALAQNLDLEAALHRIEQARAQARIAGAALLPSVDASGGATQNYQEVSNTSRWQGLATLSYELDLWGKNRNLAEAAKYRTQSSQYDREALRLIITTDTTVLYMQILGFTDRIRVAETNLRNVEAVSYTHLTLPTILRV